MLNCSIVCCEVALKIYTTDAYAVEYATTQFCLGQTHAMHATNKQSVLPVVKSEAAHPVHLARVVSGDDAYKQNCTRCHAEVSKVKDRMTNTIVRHMRVRANLTQDEARTVLEYFRQNDSAK